MPTTPTVRRLVLSNELSRLRAAANISAERAAQHIGCRVTKISRIELAQNNIQVGDVKMLAELYGDDAGHIEIMLDLARGQNQRGRWNGHRSVYPEWFRMFVDLERDANAVRSVQVEVIPGLLQTERYIRALHAGGQPVGENGEADHCVAARVERQELFTRSGPPQVSFILSESCLRRQVGSAEVMLEQLHHLIEMARLPTVGVQVLPFDTQTDAGRIAYRFTLLTIPAPRITAPLEFAYVEAHDDARYLDDKKAVAAYLNLWGRLQAAALDPADSLDFIRTAAGQLI